MRFKQALSRKLAAALSAVMILSTIAPTSVPVLAAAPDDVLVDSSAEYDLSDAGSEDLLTPAESSLAEESDALEVAEEELLVSEPASEETIVDAADAAAETGAEPAETPEGEGEEENLITVETYEGGKIPGTRSEATSVGDFTITEPSAGNNGKIKGELKYSMGNYASTPGNLVSWHPNETAGYFLAVKATVSAGYTIGYAFNGKEISYAKDGVEDGKEYLNFAMVRPWQYKTLTIAAKKDASVFTKTYDIELSYDGGPIDANLASLAPGYLLGKNASDLQEDIEISFNPVPANGETFEGEEFADGAYYGGTGTVTGTLKYQDSYPGWGSNAKGYFFAYHINADTKTLKKNTAVFEDEANEKLKVYVASSKGVETETGKDYGWKEIDYNDHIGVWEITEDNKKIVIKKEITLTDTSSVSSDSRSMDNPRNKDVYYVYDLSGVEFDSHSVNLTVDDTLSKNVIKEVSYRVSDNEAVKCDTNKVVSIDGIKNGYPVSLAITGIDDDKAYAYDLYIGDKKVTKDEYVEINKGSEDADVEVAVKAVPRYVSGTLHVDVASENVIATDNNRTVSIGSVAYEIGYGESSVISGQGGTKTLSNNDGFDIEYKDAEWVKFTVSEKVTTDGRYNYQIGSDADHKVAAETKTVSYNLADLGESVSISPVQVKFDAEVNATITSNNKIKSFNYKFDNDGSATTYNISQNTVTFSKDGAQSITLSGFTSAEDVDDDSYYIVVTADGKEVKEVEENPGSYYIPIKGTSVAVTITAVPKVKVTVSFNGVKDKFSTSSMNAYVGEKDPAEVSLDFGTGEYASFYVKNGESVFVNKVDGVAGYDFAKMAGAEISKDGTKWELGAITEDKLFTIDKVQYALSQNIVISDGHNYPISVSLNEIDGAVTDIDGSKLFTKNGSDLIVSVKTVYDKEKDNNYYELPEKDGDYSLKYVLRSGSAIDVKATRDDSDYGKYTVTIPANYIIELFEAGKVLSLKTELQKYVHNYELTFTSNPEGSATAEGYVNGKEVITLTGSGNVKEDIAYGSKVGITAKAAPGYVLKSVSINVAPHGTVTQNQVTVIKSTDKEFAEFSSASGYQITLEADTEVKFESEKEYATAVKYTTDSKEPEKDKKGVYQVINNKEVTVEYKYGTETPSSFDYSLLLDRKSVSNNDAAVKDYVKKTSNGLTINGKGLQGKTLAVTLFATDVSGNKVEKSDKELTFKIDSDKAKSVKFAKTAETVAIGGKTTLDLKVKGTFEYSLSVSGDAVKPEPNFAYNDGKYDYTKVIVYAGTAVSPDKEYTINVTDNNNSDAVLASIKVTTKSVVKDAKAPVASVVNTTNNALYLSLKANKIDTSLAGLEYKIEYTIKDTKDGTPFKAKGTYTQTVDIKATTAIISLLKDGATEAQKLDGDPDAKIDIKVSIVQKNGTTEIASTQVAELKDQSTKPGGVFATNINLKKAKGTVSKLYTSMDGSDAANKMVIDVDFGKNTSIQLLDSYSLVKADGTPVNTANYGYDATTHQFEIIPNKDGNRMTAGDYVLTAAALEPNSVPVTKSMKIKVVQGIEKIELQGNTRIYKPAGTKTTASVTAFDMSGAIKETKKVTWTLEGITDNAKAAIANKNITINGSGKISIKKDFVAKNVSFIVKATAKDFKGSKVSGSITVNVLTEASKAYELAFSNDLGGNWATLPATADVVDFFGNLGPAPDNKSYKYITYVQLRETEGTMANIPASFKVSGAKLLGTYQNDAYGTYAMIGFTKPGNVKIQATAVDGSGRAFSGKTAKVVAVNGSKGQVGYTITDAKGITIATNIAKSVATEENKSVSYNIAQGDSITLNLTGYSDKKANFINNKVSVKGGKLTKYKFFTDVYTIQPNKDVVEIKITNTDAKKTFTVTINNGAIAGGKASKTTVKGSSPADLKNGKKIYASLKFDGVTSEDKAKGFRGYASDNKISYTVAPAGDFVLVSVEKDDTNGAIDAAVAEASKVGGVATKVGGAYKIAVKDGAFAIDFIKADETFTIKPGTYKLTVTPIDKNNTALGKPATVNVQAIKVPAYKANITKNIDMTKTISTNVVTKAGKNFIKDVYFTGVLKKANIKGNLNNFDGNFQMAAGKTEIKFTGKGNKEGTPKAVTDKNEFQGYIEYQYQGLDGVVRTDYVQVTVKTPKEGLKP